MPTRKAEDKNIRSLTKAGGRSISVTIPIEMIRDLGWREKQKVVVKRINGGLQIRDWRNIK
jgi:hypothetical protein